MNILIVEDEAPIREAISSFLKSNKYHVIESTDGQDAWEKFQKQSIDLILLDINIPHINGISLCRMVREISNIPIIMITARVEDIDEVIGLEAGADDYIKKPFSMIVLLARIKKLLKNENTASLQIDDITINPEKMEVIKGDNQLNFTATQFNILLELASNPGVIYSREKLMNRVYSDGDLHCVLDRTIDTHIKNIRKQIEPDVANPTYIITVIGKGYKFKNV